MIERKSIMIYGHEKEKAIEHYALYGWKHVNTEEVIKDDYSIDIDDEYSYLCKDTYKMYKLSFERNESDKNRFIKTEYEFRTSKTPRKEVKPGAKYFPNTRFWITSIIMYIIGILMIILDIKDKNDVLGWIDYAVFAFLFGFPIIRYIVGVKRENKVK